MKTIKFRRPHLKFKDNSFSHFSYWGVNLPVKGGVTEFTSPSQNNQCYHREDQMFTGLFDKQGKEIYEGDIVKGNNFQGNVCYDLQMAGFLIKWVEKSIRTIRRYAYFNVTSGGESGFSCDNMEVIGNIYENPELCSE